MNINVPASVGAPQLDTKLLSRESDLSTICACYITVFDLRYWLFWIHRTGFFATMDGSSRLPILVSLEITNSFAGTNVIQVILLVRVTTLILKYSDRNPLFFLLFLYNRHGVSFLTSNLTS